MKKKAITEQEFKENQLKVELDYQARMAEIRKQYRDELLSDQQAFAEGFLGIELQMQDRSASEQGQAFRDSIQQAAQHNKAFFLLEKARAMASALLAARESVVTAYAFGSRIGGPFLGAAFAGVAAAAQAVNIGAIASTSFGGGSGGGSSGGGSVDSGSSGAGSYSGGGGSATAAKQVNITLIGNDYSTWSKNQIRQLISMMNDAGRDGSTLEFAIA